MALEHLVTAEYQATLALASQVIVATLALGYLAILVQAYLATLALVSRVIQAIQEFQAIAAGAHLVIQAIQVPMVEQELLATQVIQALMAQWENQATQVIAVKAPRAIRV